MIERFELNKTREAMVEAVIKTYENTAFIDVRDIAKNGEKIVFDNILGIDILKPVSSSIMLLIPNDLKNKIILNLFGNQKDELSEDRKVDTMLEILNILAGNFITAYFNNSVEYKMELPHLLMNYEEKKSGGEDLELYFDAEGIYFMIIFKSVRYMY